MSDMEKIPCSVCILTFNSGATLERSLESVKDFDEILIVDGGSTDNTLDIAVRFNARVITQDPAFKDAKGKLIDYAGARNQYLKAARNDWIFALDSDEYVPPELAAEVRETCVGSPAAYWILRLHEIGGKIITCNPGPTSRQMRFFHRAAVSAYRKPVHERVEPIEGAIVGVLKQPMRIPADFDTATIVAKWRRYLHMEMARRSSISFRKWVMFSAKEFARMVLYLVRYVGILLFCRGTRAPFRLHMLRLWYHWMLITHMFRIIRRF